MDLRGLITRSARKPERTPVSTRYTLVEHSACSTLAEHSTKARWWSTAHAAKACRAHNAVDAPTSSAPGIKLITETTTMMKSSNLQPFLIEHTHNQQIIQATSSQRHTAKTRHPEQESREQESKRTSESAHSRQRKRCCRKEYAVAICMTNRNSAFFPITKLFAVPCRMISMMNSVASTQSTAYSVLAKFDSSSKSGSTCIASITQFRSTKKRKMFLNHGWAHK